MSERWLPVIGYEGFYEVSNHGRVRSLDRVVNGRWGETLRTGRILKPRWQGHPRNKYATVWLCKNGHKDNHKVHHIVLWAFVGPIPFVGAEACHGDGDRTNNHASNLRWDTRAANAADAVKHGTAARGERNGNSRLSETAAREIKRMAENGHSAREIAGKFGVSDVTVGDIYKGRTWRHL